MAGKRRNMGRPSKKIAIMGAAAATASAVTVVMAAPKPPATADVALAAATGPYTQAITGASGAVDNGLVFMGYAGGAGAAFWNPIAASSGGWLPTFTAQTTRNDLTTTRGLLNAAAGATEGNVVPGISGDATTNVAAATVHTLVPVPGVTNELDTAADTVLVPLGSIRQAIDALNALNDTPLLGGQLAGIPTVEDVLDVTGLTATQTTFESTFSWPLFGADGKTQIGNTFIQLPSLTASTLVDRIMDKLTIGGLSVPDAPSETRRLISDTLAPLDTIASTPSVTAWIPAGSGSYHALGATLGFLAAAPIVAVGPVGALSSVPLPAIPGVPLNPASETVVAVPIVAYGADLPFGIAGFGLLTMPAVVTPAAVLVSPPLAVTYTRINTGSAPYVGPNGVYYNSGTTLGLLATSVGILPVLYSLGAVSAGPAGAGVVGPSVFGIGVLPPVQVPTANPLQVLDSANPAALVNPAGLVNTALSTAGLVNPVLNTAGVVSAGVVPAGVVPAGVVPTQLTGAVTSLGLPTHAAAVTAAVNPAISSATATSSLITKALNGSFGPAATEIAQRLVALTAELTKAAHAMPSTANGSGLPVSTPPIASVTDNLLAAPPLIAPSEPGAAVTDLVGDIGLPEDAPRNRPRLNVITGTGNSGESALVGNSRTSGGTTASGGLRSTVQNAPKRVTDAVSGTVKSVTDTVKDTVSGAVGSLGKLGNGDEG